MVDGVIFDMDGLMLDTEPIWGSCWAPALARFGYPVINAFVQESRGTTGDAQYAVCRKYYGEDADGKAILAELTRLAAAKIALGAPKKPGLDELLCYLKAQGVPMAVASSSPEAMIHQNLARAGITDSFSAIISGANVAHSKPAPDVFLAAAKALGTAPANTLVLEDSFAGVRAGHAGGFITVMVPDLAQPDEDIKKIYTACCTSLFEVKQRLEAGTLG